MTAPLLMPDGDDAAAVEDAAAGASERTASADQQDRQDQTSATPSSEPPAADDLPAPEARDAIQLFAQSPEHLFLHWNHAADPFAALREAFADDAARYRLAVRLSDLTGATEHLFEASPERAQWLPALPGRDYRADIGFRADELPFVTLLSSTIVRTPRASVSPDADAAPEFRITYEDFALLLEHTGYDLHALPQPSPLDPRDTTLSSYCHHSSGQWSAVADQRLFTRALDFNRDITTRTPLNHRPLTTDH